MSEPARRLPLRFFGRDAAAVARALLGQVLVRVLDDGTRLTGRIVETEAYLGVADRAAHSFGGRRTARNESMWGEAGRAYVYFVYGMHHCLNVVTEGPGQPSAVLLRALEPLEGLATMRRHRAANRGGSRPLPDTALCSGPARLAQALAVGRAFDGADLVAGPTLFLARGIRLAPRRISAGPRIGVDYAGEWAAAPLRFCLAGSPFLSRPA